MVFWSGIGIGFVGGILVLVAGFFVTRYLTKKFPSEPIKTKPIEPPSPKPKLEITGMDSLNCRAIQSPKGYRLIYSLRPALHNSGNKSTTLLSFTLEMLNYKVTNKWFNLKTNDLDSGNAVTPLLHGDFRGAKIDKDLLPDKAKLRLSIHYAGMKKPAIAEKKIKIQK